MATDLPTLPSVPACPAALPIAGACASQQGVVCRIMQDDQEDDPGVGMTAGALGRVRGGEGGVYLNLKGDPATVTSFCHGDALPVLSDDDDRRLARASYTRCPVWQEARNRALAGEEGLYDELEPEPVSVGVPEPDYSDPWQQARADLEELAPARVA